MTSGLRRAGPASWFTNTRIRECCCAVGALGVRKSHDDSEVAFTDLPGGSLQFPHDAAGPGHARPGRGA